MGFRVPKEQFTKENVEDLFKFLEAHGWEKRPAVFPHSIFYINTSRDEGGIEKLIFPAKINYDNQAHMRQISDGINALADYYGWKPGEFWNSIAGSIDGFDTISLIEREGENVNFVPAFSMSCLIQETLSTLDSALDAVTSGQSQDGLFMSKALLGHTFVGSYGISVKVPLIFQYELPLGSDNQTPSIVIPGERKAIEFTFKTLHLLEISASSSVNGELKDIFKEYPLFEDAIYDLIETSQNRNLTIDAIPADALPFSNGVVQKVKIRPRMFSLMGEIRKDTMPKEKEQTYLKVRGIVTGLAVEDRTSIAIEKAKNLTVKIHDEESGRKIAIKHVDPLNYLEALRAHREGRAIVVSGFVAPQRQQWIMQDARFDFSDIKEEE